MTVVCICMDGPPAGGECTRKIEREERERERGESNNWLHSSLYVWVCSHSPFYSSSSDVAVILGSCRFFIIITFSVITFFVSSSLFFSLGIGNTGKFLQTSSSSFSLFVSRYVLTITPLRLKILCCSTTHLLLLFFRDAGVSWHKSHLGSFIYEFTENGSLIVALKRGTNTEQLVCTI